MGPLMLRCHKPSGGRSCNIFCPSFCIFGKASAPLSMLQYSLRVTALAFRCKCSNNSSFALSLSDASMSSTRLAEITFLRFSIRSLNLASTTSKNSSSCFSRTCDAGSRDTHLKHYTTLVEVGSLIGASSYDLSIHKHSSSVFHITFHGGALRVGEEPFCVNFKAEERLTFRG